MCDDCVILSVDEDNVKCFNQCGQSFKKIMLYSAYLALALSNSAPVLAADNLTLHWKAPAQFTTGERLIAVNDLKEYRLYYGSSIESIKDNVVFIKPSLKSFSLSTLNLSKLKSSLVYFAMTSVLDDGSESELSPSIFYLP